MIYERHMCISTTRWQRQIHSAMNDTTSVASFERRLCDCFVNVDNRIDWCQFYEMYGVRCGVWCSVVCGVVCSAVWCVRGAVCGVCGAVRCGAVRCGAVRCGAVRCGAVRCGVV